MILWLRLCLTVSVNKSVCVCVWFVKVCVCVLLTERWLTNIGSVMFVKRVFVFEGVSKTTHSVRYSDTTDAIFSLVYICFHIPVFGLSMFRFIFFGMFSCLLVRTRVSRALPFLSFCPALFYSVIHSWYVLAQRTCKSDKKKKRAVCLSVYVYSRLSPWNLIRDRKYLSQQKKINIGMKYERYKTWCVLRSWCFFMNAYFFILLIHFRNNVSKI